MINILKLFVWNLIWIVVVLFSMIIKSLNNHFADFSFLTEYATDLRFLVEMEIEATPIPKRLSDNQEVARLLE